MNAEEYEEKAIELANAFLNRHSIESDFKQYEALMQRQGVLMHTDASMLTPLYQTSIALEEADAKVKELGKNFFEQLPDSLKMGMIKYGKVLGLYTDYSRNRSYLLRATKRENTSTEDALKDTPDDYVFDVELFSPSEAY